MIICSMKIIRIYTLDQDSETDDKIILTIDKLSKSLTENYKLLNIYINRIEPS